MMALLGKYELLYRVTFFDSTVSSNLHVVENYLKTRMNYFADPARSCKILDTEGLVACH